MALAPILTADNFPRRAHNGIINQNQYLGETMPVHPEAKYMTVEHLSLAQEYRNPAVERCCKARNRAFKYQLNRGTKPVYIYVRANAAYRDAMPPLTTPQNLCDFIACVTHGLAINVIPRYHSAPLMDAARVAARAFKLVADTAKTSAPARPQRKNKTPGCETVGWDFAGLETTTCPEEPLENGPRFPQKST
jgi:hypothetical protein